MKNEEISNKSLLVWNAETSAGSRDYSTKSVVFSKTHKGSNHAFCDYYEQRLHTW